MPAVSLTLSMKHGVTSDNLPAAVHFYKQYSKARLLLENSLADKDYMSRIAIHNLGHNFVIGPVIPCTLCKILGTEGHIKIFPESITLHIIGEIYIVPDNLCLT